MGKRYSFCCSECGYKFLVSGGHDAGMSVHTVTVWCFDCGECKDVVSSRFAPKEHGPKDADSFQEIFAMCLSGFVQVPCGGHLQKSLNGGLFWD
jgi:hypothetical protein